MKKLLPILILLLVHTFSFGQQKGFWVAGTILDSASQEPIANVGIKVNESSVATLSNANGKFSLRVQSATTVLCFTHLNYETFQLSVKSSVPAQLLIKLKKKTTILSVVDITTHKPQTLAKGQPLYIKDYDFYDDKIIALAYRDKMLSKPLICLLNADGDTICTVKIKDNDGLYRDCFGNDHLLTKSTAWQLDIDSNIVDFVDPSDIEEFNEFLRPVIAEKDNKFFYQKYYYNNQLLQYFYYDKSARKTTELKVIMDEKKLFMLRDAQRIVAGSDDPETQARFENMAF